MPEGDTIHRAAQRLDRVAAGRLVVCAEAHDCDRFTARGGRGFVSKLAGLQIASVEARGKNLIVHFESELALLSHMGMTGSWHIYRSGQEWQKPRHYAALEMTLESELGDRPRPEILVCFSPFEMKLLSARRLTRHERIEKLGPDILSETFDLERVLSNLRDGATRPLAEVLLDQRICCGIGNIYKSEGLFLSGIHPNTEVSALSDESLLSLYSQTRRVMRTNFEGYRRRTRERQKGPRVWVYQRRAEPCFRCQTPIRMARHGVAGRSSYWCPSCQPETAAEHSK